MEFKICVLPGDGIGPEITEQAVKAIDAVCRRFGHKANYTYAPVGAAAIDSCGEPYPDSTHRVCMESDAILFGAIGDPRFDNDPGAKVRPEQGLLAMRKKLGLYANIRPVNTFPSLAHRSPLRADLVDGVDFVFLRELTGGLYFGRPQGRSEDGLTAYDTCVYSREEIERICGQTPPETYRGGQSQRFGYFAPMAADGARNVGGVSAGGNRIHVRG